MRILLVSATLMGLGTTAATQAATPQRVRDQQVCTNTPVTGSRFSRRVCRTQSEIDATRDQQQRDAQEAASRPLINPVCTGPNC